METPGALQHVPAILAAASLMRSHLIVVDIKWVVVVVGSEWIVSEWVVVSVLVRNVLILVHTVIIFVHIVPVLLVHVIAVEIHVVVWVVVVILLARNENSVGVSLLSRQNDPSSTREALALALLLILSVHHTKHD